MRVYQYNDELKSNARSLRKSQTEAERLLWYKLRSRQIKDIKFYRQYVIGKYILDFYSPSVKLAVELDGSQHLQNKVYDNNRTKFLQKYGIRVIRFWDNDVLTNTEGVLEVIRKELIT